MAYTCDRRQFTVTVSSGFISDWQWAVHANVDYRSFGTVGIRKEIEAEARLELMIGISRECRHGRERGARTVIVLVEGDREIAGFFRGLPRDYGAPRAASNPEPGIKTAARE
jgi:hypothetical protein